MSGDRGQKAYERDYAIATMYRLDPDKIAAVRRAISGKTRCPECDEVNPADQPRCQKCNAKLYPEVPDNEEERLRKLQARKRKRP